MCKSQRHHGFVLMESLVALSLLCTGLFGVEGLEILMVRSERRTVRKIVQKRTQYEQHRLRMLTGQADG
ncbi:hypothetical protein [Lactiplantibacillus modestisalitolerans]|uniref:Prepilin-type N-terminal cleavage/methylation domain-containing protein n=1 Tax=Lactiplantibacillus modestisalitolerans TaxID=1457219 RepID=A0ABV5WVB7_9LACO|nr:hypothetical protein [Lactiplantibacillus modestisalitolerans]